MHGSTCPSALRRSPFLLFSLRSLNPDKLAIVPGSGVSFSVADGAAKITADFGFDIPNPLVNLKYVFTPARRL
jgi:hypothetical protein